MGKAHNNLPGIHHLAGFHVHGGDDARRIGHQGCAMKKLIAYSLNQPLFIVLGTLLLWQSRRDAPLARWWPLLLTATAAFLIKEDNVLLLPAVAALHLVRAYWLGIPARHRVAAPVIALAAAAGLTLWRTLALGEIGGFLRPSGVEQLTRNLLCQRWM